MTCELQRVLHFVKVVTKAWSVVMILGRYFCEWTYFYVAVPFMRPDPVSTWVSLLSRSAGKITPPLGHSYRSTALLSIAAAESRHIFASTSLILIHPQLSLPSNFR